MFLFNGVQSVLQPRNVNRFLCTFIMLSVPLQNICIFSFKYKIQMYLSNNLFRLCCAWYVIQFWLYPSYEMRRFRAGHYEDDICGSGIKLERKQQTDCEASNNWTSAANAACLLLIIFALLPNKRLGCNPVLIVLSEYTLVHMILFP